MNKTTFNFYKVQLAHLFLLRLMCVCVCVFLSEVSFAYPKTTNYFGATWVAAQTVKHLTLGFGSDPDLRVMRSSSASGSMLSKEYAYNFLPLSLALHLHAHSL